MTRKHVWISTALVASLTILAGCSQTQRDALTVPMMADVKKVADKGVEIAEQHGKDMKRQHTAMHPEAEAAIAESAKQFEKELARIAKEIKTMEGTMGQNILNIAGLLTKLTGIDGSVFDFVSIGDTAGRTANDTTNALVGGVADANEKNRAEIAAFKKAYEGFSEETRKARAALNKKTDVKFSEVTAQTVKDLAAAAKVSRAEFDRVLTERLELTSKEMEALSGMSTDQILALIGASIAAAGAGAVAGKGGKSRAQGDIDRMKDALAAVEAAIERQKQPE